MPAAPQPHPLSAAQESRLVLYLDDRLLRIGRSFRTRHEHGSDLRTLRAFLDAWRTPMELVTATPLVGSSANVHDAYLLRLTTEITDGIPGYATRDDAELGRDAQLVYVLYWLDLLDQAWAARIQREPFDLAAAQTHTLKRFPWSEEHAALAAAKASAASLRSPAARVSTPVSSELAPYGQTDSVRLRNVLLGAQERLFGWMRDELGLPRPPMQADGEAEEAGAPAADPGDEADEPEPEEAEDQAEEPREAGSGEKRAGPFEGPDAPADARAIKVDPEATAEPAGPQASSEVPEVAADPSAREYTALFDKKVGCVLLPALLTPSLTPTRTRRRPNRRSRPRSGHAASRRRKSRSLARTPHKTLTTPRATGI